MYLILSNPDSNATSIRASEVFHDGIDVIGLRAAREEKGHRRSSAKKEKVHRRRSDREGPPDLLFSSGPLVAMPVVSSEAAPKTLSKSLEIVHNIWIAIGRMQIRISMLYNQQGNLKGYLRENSSD